MDGKLWRENEKENFFDVCLVVWEGKKINGRIRVFSPLTHQKVLSKIRRKLKGENRAA